MSGRPRPSSNAVAAPRVLDVDIVREAGAWGRIDGVEELIRSASAAVAACDEIDLGDAATATIALGDDALVRDLNKRFRQQDKATNVLSFASPDDDDATLGDIVFALETIEREASNLGIPVAHHLQHLTVHGLLHLLGFDHLTAGEADEMERLETSILAGLGVPDPYADSDPLPP
jgi:probable rRNA maturation factor